MTGQTPRYCRCGEGYLSRGVRIGPGPGERTAVLVCWRCAYEEPSSYGRSHKERNGGKLVTPRPRDERVPIGGARW